MDYHQTPIESRNFWIKSKTGPFNEENPQNSNQKSLLIKKYLKRLSDNDLFGRPHVKSYLTELHRRGCRPNTIRQRFTSIFLFISFLKGKGRSFIEEISRDDLGSFIEFEQDRGLKPKSVNGRLDGLYAFLTYLEDKKVIRPEILKKKMRVKVPDTLPRAIDPQDIQKFLSVIRKPRDWAMILILLRTGMRIGELLDTRISDINLRENRIDVYEARKTRVGRVVYLSDDARIALKVWLKERDKRKDHLFHGRGNRETIGYETARVMFRTYMEKAGLAYKGYTMHCLRHTFASELLNAGMRLECVQQLLGHSCIEMTRRYARLTDNTRKEEYFKAMSIIENGGINGQY